MAFNADRLTSTDVLRICGIWDVKTFMLQSQFRWIGILRISIGCIPNQIFLCAAGKRLQGCC